MGVDSFALSAHFLPALQVSIMSTNHWWDLLSNLVDLSHRESVFVPKKLEKNKMFVLFFFRCGAADFSDGVAKKPSDANMTEPQ